jgi:phosphoglycerate dehydrogenase-like enzyme
LEVEHREQLIATAPECSWTFNTKPTDEEVAAAEIIFGNLPLNRYSLAKNLRFVQLQSAGVGNLAELCAPGRGIRLCNATGSYGLTITEHMFGMLLGLVRKLFRYRDQQREGSWKDCGYVQSVYGSKVLVIGMGDIGSEFAKRCKAFGADVTGIRRSEAPCPEYCDRVGVQKDADQYLPDADIVFLCMPETPQTVKFMNRDRIFSMKKGAILLNAGRGTAVDTDALVEALQCGHLSGAGVDVTDPEPLPPEHPLWQCENAIVTPHVAGWFYLRRTHDNVVGIAARNIRAYLDGKPLESEVEYERGY